MEENIQDIYARAYATLSSLRNNISQIKDNPTEAYVNEYHSVLDKLGEIGVDLSEFRILESMVNPKCTFSSISSNGRVENRYTDEKYIDRHFLLIKIDAVLGYLKIITSKKPRKMGFHQPEKQ